MLPLFHTRSNMNAAKIDSRIRSIEALVLKILHSNPPTIEFQDGGNVENLQFTDRVVTKSKKDAHIRYIRFSNKRSRPLFTSIIHLLAKIHDMLKTNSCFTRREIYYQEIEIFTSQQIVDSALLIISHLLNTPSWELNIMSSPKGLVIGPLLMKTPNDDIINCSSPGGTLIPHIITSENTEMRTLANYVLLVEKDATFQKILDENILDKLKDLIIVTGKGYPDVYTRILVKKLNEDFNLPILALVDGDPDGISIMCVYRFGSAKMSTFASNLATPDIKWIGIHPSDLECCPIVTVPLVQAEEKKLKALADKQFIQSNERLLKEVNTLLQLGRKAEIEFLYQTSSSFQMHEYIRYKIINNQLY